MRRIFISYRRTDAEYAAGALARELRRHFGEHQVFRDKENISGGVAWRQHVLASIDRGSAVLVLMGKDWVNVRGEHGTRRLDDPYDPVRTEILDGGRDGAAILPILLDDANMPRAFELPLDLRPLADLNALRLRDGDWCADFHRICQRLEEYGFAPVRPPSSTRQRGMPIKLMASYLVGTLALLGWAFADDRSTHHGFAIFGLVAALLAARAYQEYRQGKSTFLWLSLTAVALGACSIVGNAVSASQFAPAKPAPVPSPTAEADVARPDRVAELESVIAPVADRAGPSPASRPNPPNPGPRPNLPNTEPRPGSPNAEQGMNPATNTRPPVPLPSLAGRWIDTEDHMQLEFTQQARHVYVKGGIIGEIVGEGELVGRRLQLVVHFPLGNTTAVEAELSEDNQWLRGTQTAAGQRSGVALKRL